jgi:hypothetical protein
MRSAYYVPSWADLNQRQQQYLQAMSKSCATLTEEFMMHLLLSTSLLDSYDLAAIHLKGSL